MVPRVFNPCLTCAFVCAFLAAGLLTSAFGEAAEAPAREVRERIEFLRREVARHDELYFRHAAPEISDADYDQLKRELGDLETSHPDAARAAASIAGAGFDDRSGAFPTARHAAPMLSLEKAYDEEELRAFYRANAARFSDAGARYIIEPKVDGLAVSVVFERGRLARAVTRGNGREGDDITASVRTIAALPHELRGEALRIPERVELRGELYLTFEEFNRINREREAEGEEPFAHPRNLAAGTAKTRDLDALAERRLALVFFGWGEWHPVDSEPASYGEFREQLRGWGLPVCEPARIVTDEDALVAAVRVFENERAALPYPVDGCVVKLDPVALQRELGQSEQAPRWALAFKFAPERVSTKLLGITIQVGRSGVLTPVAELEPVELRGATISRASLHNREVIARLGLRIGDEVFVERAGEVIPTITGVDLERRERGLAEYVFPENCPSCPAPVVTIAGEAAVRCASNTCPGRLCKRIGHYASERCLDIRGLGPATIERLVGSGRLRGIADLYGLRIEDLNTAEDGATKSARDLLHAIDQSRQAELWRVVHGLGIPRVGSVTARRVASAFPSLERLARAGPADFRAGGGGAAAR
ncbi:MAG: NAD-dependent DNA ligase LigA, partial [Opitutaceae bacterium]